MYVCNKTYTFLPFYVLNNFLQQQVTQSWDTYLTFGAEEMIWFLIASQMSYVANHLKPGWWSVC